MYHKSLWITLLFAIFPYASPGNVSKGVCGCSVMRKDDRHPIFENNLQINVPCDKEGTDTCQRLCIALAESAKEEAPNVICEKLNETVINLQVELYSKICDDAEWKATGLKNIEPLCCKDGKSTMCSLMY
ncbi:follicle cell protein 3C-1-like [Belonocnema kinseyi]|uniref:follicle cell protein 3C-1-like n=1 Tax=Belonocnema kinseyi TaxID=2817044 RepID=UPI00143D4A42|nr:follicle cell protein 3C-1-like [Belonocnema kinseyi]